MSATSLGLILHDYRRLPSSFWGRIPDVDIWRAAQLMLKRDGDKVLEESAARAHELTTTGDDTGAAT